MVLGLWHGVCAAVKGHAPKEALHPTETRGSLCNTDCLNASVPMPAASGHTEIRALGSFLGAAALRAVASQVAVRELTIGHGSCACASEIRVQAGLLRKSN